MAVEGSVRAKVLLDRETDSDVRYITVVRHYLGVSTTLIHAGPQLPLAPRESAYVLGVGTLVVLVIGYDVYRKATE